jgi:hypothetical protein
MTTSSGTTTLSAWFQQASQLDIDFVAKVDLQTLVIPSRFFDFMEETLSSSSPLRRSNIYGGSPRDRWECGGMKKWQCRQMAGKTFMSPELYFLSRDLAEMVPDDLKEEDPLSVANWVFNLPTPVLQVTMRPSLHGLWENEEGSITPNDYRKRWNYLVDQQFAKKELHSTTSTETQSSLYVPRYEGKSLLDEFYRRVPWGWFPDRFTRWNLP